MGISTNYIKTLVGILFAFLCIWIGVTGRVGSLLGSLITPDYMVVGVENLTTSYSGVNPPVIINGGVATMDQIAQLAYNAGLTTVAPLTTATAIAMAESSGNVTAVNSIGATGIWQILISAHPEYSTAQMQDPVQNAAAMYAVSSAGTNWNAWVTYKTGAYLQFVPQATISATATITNSQGGGV